MPPTRATGWTFNGRKRGLQYVPGRCQPGLRSDVGQSHHFLQRVDASVDNGAYGEQFTLKSLYTDPATYGCQMWSAIAFSTPVRDNENDGEGDGLIDRLETPPAGFDAYQRPQRHPVSAPVGDGCAPRPEGSLRRNQQHGGSGRARITDRRTHPFPLVGAGPRRAGVVTDSAGHDHRPLPTTLTMVGEALLRAGVHVHFDVGPLESGGTGYRVNDVFRPFPAASPGDDRVPVYPKPSTYFINDGRDRRREDSRERLQRRTTRRLALPVSGLPRHGRLEVRVPAHARRGDHTDPTILRTTAIRSDAQRLLPLPPLRARARQRQLAVPVPATTAPDLTGFDPATGLCRPNCG